MNDPQPAPNVVHGPATVIAPSSYQLDVVGTSVSDIVTSSGAWLFDRAKAGWKVRIFATALCDPTALYVLGAAQVAPADEIHADGLEESTALALSGAALASDPLLARRVHTLAKSRRKEVVFWPDPPEKLRHVCEQVSPVGPSPASKVFKAHAMASAGLDTEITRAQETFYRTTRLILSYESDLVCSATTSWG